MAGRKQDREATKQIAQRIGEHVRGERLARWLTQEELAELIGMTAEAFGRLERGVSAPSYPTLLKLCEVLELSPNDLLLERADGSRKRTEEYLAWSRLPRAARRSLLEAARLMGRGRRSRSSRQR